jgi:transcription initiation factor TFIID subunit 6
LSKQLCENPSDDHWTLRKYAARLIAHICQRFGETYEHLQARISKTFHKAITDPQCPFTTQFGALHGIMNLGPLVMEILLFPNLTKYFTRLEPAMACSNSNLIERLEAQNCFGILVVSQVY